MNVKVINGIKLVVSDGGKDKANYRPYPEGYDCTIRAYAIVSGISYDLAAQAAVKFQGYYNDENTKFADFVKHCGTLHLIADFEECKDISVREIVQKYQDKKVVCRVHGHVFAIVHGTIFDDEPEHDLYRSVLQIWEFNP